MAYTYGCCYKKNRKNEQKKPQKKILFIFSVNFALHFM
ncbi:MAG: hypothetical protein K0Q79_3138 [Flavipsychrobacter sp.]|jgi:hypothetical protein|nr:hypothetical protein [Flavipsychrobacter sp.]